ncbi:MAG: hypothetical protein CL927_12855 [Deltaproteobacteria bacterium]|mgnify:CR=1 FL=1|nr:hypothetical protein [Deltaproteobacteria bacterium]
MPPSQPANQVYELDADASAFLDVLVESGHLDEALLEKVNDRVLDLSPESGIITGADMRRVAAEILFDAMDSLSGDQQRVLEVEWPLLFH